MLTYDPSTGRRLSRLMPLHQRQRACTHDFVAVERYEDGRITVGGR